MPVFPMPPGTFRPSAKAKLWIQGKNCLSFMLKSLLYAPPRGQPQAITDKELWVVSSAGRGLLVFPTKQTLPPSMAVAVGF